MSEFRPCVIIPCYNHAGSLPGVLASLAPTGLPVIIVDDASEPPVPAVPAVPAAVLLRHDVNQGKGGAVITGLREAARLGYTHALQIDADGQHDAAAVPALLEAARREPDALVSGAPLYDASAPASRRHGRLLTNAWVWLETLSFQIKDSMCGLRVYPLAATLALLDRRRLGRRMDFDVEILVRLFWDGVPARFVPVRVTYPAGGVSHFHPVRDNLRVSWMHTRLVLEMLPHLPALLRRKIGARTGARVSAPPAAAHWSDLSERRGAFGMRLLFLIYRLLGPRGVRPLLYPVTAVFWLTAGGARRCSRDYLRRVRERAAATGVALPPRLNSYRHLLRFGFALLTKIGAWRGDIPPESIRVTETPELRRQLDAHKGGIVFCPHFGNFELFRAVAEQRGVIANAVFHTRHAEKFNAFLREVAPESQLRIVPTDAFGPATAVSMQERLAAGEWVSIAPDRTAPDNRARTVGVEFLGATAQLPQGPFLLAAALQCPVFLLVAGTAVDTAADDAANAGANVPNASAGSAGKTPHAGRTAYFETLFDPLKIPRADRSAALQRAAQHFADRLEHHVLRSPLDWFNFFDFWAPPNTTGER
ncbi:MAG: glycosyltransferase family 2 protein [Puniceicoccales bacterium]|jgi:predicted LPLAT superfamily acyltransferase|nr:glycosyltransferase family 2 protein [Puniceicoccales bacterium]